jgi:hypothetical protein
VHVRGGGCAPGGPRCGRARPLLQQGRGRGGGREDRVGWSGHAAGPPQKLAAYAYTVLQSPKGQQLLPRAQGRQAGSAHQRFTAGRLRDDCQH